MSWKEPLLKLIPVNSSSMATNWAFGDWRALRNFVTASLKLSRLTSMSLELVLYLRAVGGRARTVLGFGARGSGRGFRPARTDEVIRGLEGAGWTFVKAAARRLLGGLHGHRERVSRRAPATYGVARLPSCLLVCYRR